MEIQKKDVDENNNEKKIKVVDGDKVGISQGAFATFKVSSGEHVVKLEEKNKKYEYIMVYKKIEIADKLVIDS